MTVGPAAGVRMSTITQKDREAGTVYVWDRFVRSFHWSLVTAFFIAYLTEEDVMELHAWAGYVVGALVLARIVWGFVGPERARFTDFVTSPVTATRYVVDLLLLRSKRHLGHSPGGGAMVVILLICLAITVGLGLMLYGAEWHAGPLASFYGPGARRRWRDAQCLHPSNRGPARVLRELHLRAGLHPCLGGGVRELRPPRKPGAVDDHRVQAEIAPDSDLSRSP